MEKKFEEMNELERLRHNEQYILNQHQLCIKYLEENNLYVMSRFALEREVEKCQKFIYDLNAALEAGKTLVGEM